MEYKDIYSTEKLYEAHKKAKKGKRGKKETIQYELNLAYNTGRTKEELEKETYRPGKYNQFTIYEPKKRIIQALHYKDRIIQHSLCDNILTPYLEKRLIQDNCACRKNKGTSYGLKRLSEQLRQHWKKNGNKGWFLKADIKKYFASIDHRTLKQQIAKEKLDEKTKKLINKIIDSYNKETGKGLPIGNQTSQAFGLYYMDKIDRYIKEKQQIKAYIRYMDDMILIHENKEKLKQTLEGMKQIAKQLKLQYNEKTQITPLKNGIDFLGWHTYITETGKIIRKLRQSSKKRIFARIKKLKKEYAKENSDTEKIYQSLAAMLGHMQQGNTEKLKEKILKQLVFTKNKPDRLKIFNKKI